MHHKEKAFALVQGLVKARATLHVCEIPLRSAGDDTVLCEPARELGHGGRVQPGSHAPAQHQVVQVTEQSEPGHIRGGVCPCS